MNYIIVQGDGMGDRPHGGHRTPLESAHTPNFDRIAACGEFGLVRTIPEGYPPGSDVGNLSLFGYDPHLVYTGRSPLEAAAMGVAMGNGDISLRMNLVTLTQSPAGDRMEDYSAGHIDSESSAKIVRTISESLASESIRFYAGVSYRHLLVWRNGPQELNTTPPHDITGKLIAPHVPTGNGADELRRIMDATRELLQDHPANRARVKAGHKPVTQVWFWGQGHKPEMDTFESRHNLRGACISAVDLVRGVAVNAGFDIITVPGATGYLDTDYAAKARYALDALSSVDLVFLHVEAPDEAGHMGDRAAKIEAIESIDGKIVGLLLEKLPALGPFKIMLVSDHATPYALRTHTPDPVPYAMASGEQLQQQRADVKYGETGAKNSGTVIEQGHLLIERLLQYC